MRGKPSSVAETWKEVCVINLVLSFVQTIEEIFNCAFRELATSDVETSGEKRGTKKALVLTLLETTGGGEELRTPYIGVLNIFPSVIFTTYHCPNTIIQFNSILIY
jgi:hypothetical protein